MASLNEIPAELVRHVFLYVSPEDNIRALQTLSHRLHKLADDALLWRHYCRISYKYWAPEHDLARKLASPASDVDWKRLWLRRQHDNDRVAHLLDQILSTKVGRLWKFGQICRLGYDAKDYLLDQCHAGDDVEDVLARRYYAKTALGSIHRSLAVKEWSKYQSGTPTVRGLDRGLGAFDMFVLHDQEGDMDDIQGLLDDYAAQFRSEHPALGEMSIRDKALALLRWVRSNNLVGMDMPEDNYRNLRNCLIGQALTDETHQSLPIISSAIYVCIAQRLDISAACCAIPSHVHAIVFAPRGATLDGRPVPPGGDDDDDDDDKLHRMFLDPYESSEEVTVEELEAKLVELSWDAEDSADVFLRPTPSSAIIQRTAQNIKASWTVARELPSAHPAAAGLRRLRAGDPEQNLDAMLYASMWAPVFTTPTRSEHWAATLTPLLRHFAALFSEDAWLVEEHLLPLYDAYIAARREAGEGEGGMLGPGSRRLGWENASATLGMVRNLDARQPQVSRRYTQDIIDSVKYRIGQVFRHRRYGYVGIINGWAPNDADGLPTPHSVNTEDVLETGPPPAGAASDAAAASAPASGSATPTPRYRKQTFYTCLRSAEDRHVVAQDNVEIITDEDEIPPELFNVAGKFFKRFDKETCTFVSNIKEFYPDD